MKSKPKSTTVKVTQLNWDFVSELQLLPEYGHLTSFNAVLTHLFTGKHKKAYSEFLQGLEGK